MLFGLAAASEDFDLDYLLSFFLTFIYLFLRECVSRRGAEKEGDREPQAGSVLSAQGPMKGLNL